MKNTLTIFFLFFAIVCFGQKNHLALGVRSMGGGGISLKTTDDDFHGLEIILDFLHVDEIHEIRLSGLVEHQQLVMIDRITNLYMFWGGGAHIGIQNNSNYFDPVSDRYLNTTLPVIGPDAIIGFEYRFESVPFEIALDNLTSLNFPLGGTPDFNMVNINFKIRYIFNHPNKLTL